MNGNAELLNFVFQNAQMGVLTIEKLIELSEDPQFTNVLKSQFHEYECIHNAANELLAKNEKSEKGISTYEKIKTYIMINMQTLTDKSVSHIAEMLMVGSVMGIIQALRNLRKYNDTDRTILDLMDRLLKFEEKNITELKQFI